MESIRKVKVELDGDGYSVIIINGRNQIIKPFRGLTQSQALTEATDWADFCGITMTPFRWKGDIVKPVSRGTYSETTLNTREELIAEYRMPTGELNFNKLMHWEWLRYQNIYVQKMKMLEWLLPYFVSGPHTPTWLEENCVNAWFMRKDGYHFFDERDATLYKLFYGGK